jgi:hypothetical protein
MKGKFQFAGIVALAMLAGMLAEPAFAQRGRGQRLKKRPPAAEQARPAQPQQQTTPPQAPAQTPPAGQPQGAGGQGGPGKAFMPGRGPGDGAGVPPQWLERLHQMSPQDQERFMNNNQRFRNLPPERQTEIRQRLRRWNSMTPQQQDEFRRRQRVLESMTPEERKRIREEIMPRWQQLSQDRRQPIMRRLRALNGLTDEERETRLKDEAFLRGLKEEDRELLRELARLRMGGGPQEGPQENPPLD